MSGAGFVGFLERLYSQGSSDQKTEEETAIGRAWIQLATTGSVIDDEGKRP